MMNRPSYVAVLTVLLAATAATLAAPPALAATPRIATIHVGGPAAPGEDGAPVHRDRKVVVVPGDGPGPVIFQGLSGGYLGVELTELTPELRLHFGVPDDRGVMIGRVEDDSPATAAGLAVGDIVTAIDGEPVESSWDLSLAVRRHDGGDAVDLEVWRDGRALDLTATLDEREREQIDLGRLLPRREGLPKLEGMHWFQGEDLEGDDGEGTRIIVRPEIVRELGKSLDTVDWPMLDGRLRERNRELEKRLEQLEDKLEQLEKRLDETVPES
jgi:membrane-associated protease RseP (regulator of RpoE activity)